MFNKLFFIIATFSFPLLAANFAEIIYKSGDSRPIHVELSPGPKVKAKMLGMNYSYENRVVNIYPEGLPQKNVLTTIETLKKIQSQFSNEGGISGAANIFVITKLPLALFQEAGGDIIGTNVVLATSRLFLLGYGLLGKDIAKGWAPDEQWEKEKAYDDFYENYERVSLRSILDFSNPIPEIVKAKTLDSLIADFSKIELNCQSKVININKNILNNDNFPILNSMSKAAGFQHNSYSFLNDLLKKFLK